MAQVIGFVTQITGVVQAVDQDGSVRVLIMGDPVYANETITSVGGNSSATITFEDGRTINMEGDEVALLDDSVYNGKGYADADVSALQQALLDGNALPEEATAAGQEGPTSDGGQSDVFTAERTGDVGGVDSYVLGTDFFVSDIDNTIDPLFNLAPEASDDKGFAIEEGDGGEDQYDAPLIAVGNVLDNDTDDGFPQTADLDVVEVSGVATVDGNGNFIINGLYGVLSMNAETGAYEYIVDDDNPIVDKLNIGDTLQEVFTYTVSDGEKVDTANLTITINGANDAPIAFDDTTGRGLTIVQGEIVPRGFYGGNDEYYDEGQQEVFLDELPGISIDAWSFTHNGGPLTIDILTENGNGFIDINNDNIQSFLDSMIQLYRVDDNGDFIERVAGDDDGGLGTDGSTSGLDSILTFVDLAAGNYVLEISDFHFGENELGQEYQTDQTPYYGEGNYTYGIGAYQITFDGNVQITGIPQLGKIISEGTSGNNAVEEGMGDAELNQYNLPIVSSGNVLMNDTDVDNIDYGDDNVNYELRVIDVHAHGTDSDTSEEEGTFVIEGQYGTLILNADGSYEYTASNDNGELNSLNEGDVVTDSFTYTVSDNEATNPKTDTAVLTITIEGKNDAPVAYADTNAVATETGMGNETSATDDAIVATGNVLMNDTDVDNTDYTDDTSNYELSIVDVEANDIESQTFNDEGTFSIQGLYGVLKLHSDGTYTYTVDDENPTVDALNLGDTLSESFTYTVSDNETTNPKTDTAVLTITINGANDAPIAVADESVAKEFGSGNFLGEIDWGHTALGNVLSNDIDVDNTTQNLDVVSVSSDETGHSDSTANWFGTLVVYGEYGTLYLNQQTGSYIYSINNQNPDVNALNEGDTLSESFTYIVTDDENGNQKTDTASLTITIQGTNDAPIAISETAHAVEYGYGIDEQDEPGVSATGNVLANEVDVDNVDHNDVPQVGYGQDDLTIEAVWVSGVQGSYTAIDHQMVIQGQYGTLTIGQNGGYTYEVDDDNNRVNGMNEGDVLIERFGYVVSDNESGNEKHDTAYLTITIHGANDAPVIDVENSTVEGIITELTDLDVDENSITHEETGTIVYNDVDWGDTHSASAVAQGSGYLGTFSFNDDTEGTVTWKFEVDDSTLDSLSSTQTLTQTYLVTVRDEGGKTATEVVTITINGTNDAPEVSDKEVQLENGMASISLADFNLGGAKDIEDDLDPEKVTQIKIETLPTDGTLYVEGVAVEVGDVFDETVSFEYVSNHNGSVLFGTKDDIGAESDWGIFSGGEINFSKEGITGTISASSNFGTETVVFQNYNIGTHDGTGIGVTGSDDGQIDWTNAEKLIVEFDAPLANAEVGLSSVGGHFVEGTTPNATAVWIAYLGADIVAQGAERQDATDDGNPNTVVVNIDVPFDRIELYVDSNVKNSNFSLQYIEVNEAFEDSFTYSAIDSDGMISNNTATVILTETNTNFTPDASDDKVITSEDTPAIVSMATLLANDTDSNSDILTITSVQAALYGSVYISGSDIVFIPEPDFIGQASFTYTVSDGQGATDTATVIVDVKPISEPQDNTPPVVMDGLVVEADFGGFSFARDSLIMDAEDDLDLTNLSEITKVKIESLPLYGTLQTGGVDVEVGDIFIEETNFNYIPFDDDVIDASDVDLGDGTVEFNFGISATFQGFNENSDEVGIDYKEKNGLGVDSEGNGNSTSQVNPGEMLRITFDTEVDGIEIGFKSIEGTNNQAEQNFATWVAYKDGSEVSTGAISSSDVVDKKATLTLDFEFDTIEIINLLGDNSANASFGIASVEILHTATDDTVNFSAIDSDGAVSIDVATLTLDINPLQEIVDDQV